MFEGDNFYYGMGCCVLGLFAKRRKWYIYTKHFYVNIKV
jgi:hypothetical protein